MVRYILSILRYASLNLNCMFFCCLLLLTGVPPEVLPNLHDHAYARPPAAAERSKSTVVRPKKSHIGYSTLCVSDGQELNLSNPMMKCTLL